MRCFFLRVTNSVQAKGRCACFDPAYAAANDARLLRCVKAPTNDVYMSAVCVRNNPSTCMLLPPPPHSFLSQRTCCLYKVALTCRAWRSVG